MKFYLTRFRAARFALVFLLLIFKSSHTIAQESRGIIKGLVLNSTGEPLNGVTIIARNTKTNSTSGTSTDNTGNFTFSKIASGGPYSFTFSTVGYEDQTVSGYNIKDDITLSLKVSMKSTMAKLDEVVLGFFYSGLIHRYFRYFLKACISIETDNSFTCLASFGGYKNNTIRSA